MRYFCCMFLGFFTGTTTTFFFSFWKLIAFNLTGFYSFIQLAVRHEKKWNERILAHKFNDDFSVRCHVHPVAAPNACGMRMSRNWADASEVIFIIIGGCERWANSTFVVSPSRNQVIAQRKRKLNIEIKKKSLIFTMKKEKHDKCQKKLNTAGNIHYDLHPLLRKKCGKKRMVWQ